MTTDLSTGARAACAQVAALIVCALAVFSSCAEHRATARAEPAFGLREDQQAPADRSTASVVLVHGLDEPGTIWLKLIPALRSDGLQVKEFRYPNDQGIRPTVRMFAEELTRLRGSGVERIDLVAHSMGGLVCRELLTAPDIDRSALPAVRSVIMVATPNHGSDLARFHLAAEAREQVVRLFTGESHWRAAWTDGHGEASQDLMPDSKFLRELNARPLPGNVAMSIIAGDSSPIHASGVAKATGWMRGHLHFGDAALADWQHAFDALSNGLGDGAVSVESTKIDGVSDHIVLHANHIALLEGSRSAPGPAVAAIRERLRIKQ
jgi:pimeloyl-ACP methyl ester carboxylesterase